MGNYNSAYTGPQLDAGVRETNNETVADLTALKNLSPADAQLVRVLDGAPYAWVDGDTTAADGVLIVESSKVGYRPGDDNEGRWKAQRGAVAAADWFSTIAEAVAATDAAGDPALDVPPGSYSASANLFLQSIGEINGHRKAEIVFDDATSLIVGKTQGAAEGRRGTTVRGLDIDGTDATAGHVGVVVGTGLDAQVGGTDSRTIDDDVQRNGANTRITECRIQQFDTGVKYEANCWNTRFDNNWIENCDKGLHIDLDGMANSGSNMVFRDSIISDNTTYGVYIEGASQDGLSPKFIGVNSEGNGTDYYFTRPYAGEMYVSLIGCHSELPTLNNVYIDENVNVTIKDCNIHGPAAPVPTSAAISSNITAGDTTISIASEPAAWSRIAIDPTGVGAGPEYFTVKSVSGAGPYDVVLDGGVVGSYTAGVETVSYAQVNLIVNKGRLFISGGRIIGTSYAVCIVNDGGTLILDEDVVVSAGGAVSGSGLNVFNAAQTITATSTVTVGAGKTLNVAAIGQPLDSGTVLTFTDTGKLTLTSAAAFGATSLTGDVTVATIDSGEAASITFHTIFASNHSNAWKNERFQQWRSAVTPTIGVSDSYGGAKLVKYTRPGCLHPTGAKVAVSGISGDTITVFLRVYGSTNGYDSVTNDTPVLTFTSDETQYIDPVELAWQSGSTVLQAHQVDCFAKTDQADNAGLVVTVTVSGIKSTA